MAIKPDLYALSMNKLMLRVFEARYSDGPIPSVDRTGAVAMCSVRIKRSRFAVRVVAGLLVLGQ